MIRTRKHNNVVRGASGNGRASHGFTMTEVLVALGIIVILGAIAVPNIFNIMTQTKMDFLDGQAKEIYLAASSQLRSTASNGGLATETSTPRAAIQSSAIATWTAGEHPVDYPSGLLEGAELVALGSGSSAMASYVLPSDGSGITAATPGHWVIEFNPVNAEVYSVFYAEDGGPSNIHSAADLWGVVSSRSDLSRDARTPIRVGYYNGKEVQPTVTPSGGDPFENANVQLVNSEELYVRIQGDFAQAYRDNPSGLTMTLSLYGPYTWSSPESSWGFTTINAVFSGSELVSEGSWQADSGELDIILDSMRDNLSWNDFMQKYAQGSNPYAQQRIIAGANFSATLNVSYTSGGGISYTHDYDLGTTNSLFSGDSSMTIGDGKDHFPSVSCVRHLNNLRYSKSGEQYTFFRYHDVVIGGDIDFDDAHWAPEAVSAQSRSAGRAVNPLPYFDPIVFHSEFNNGMGTVFGSRDEPEHDYVIRNFVIGNKDAAMRDRMDSCSLLYNPQFSISYVHIENFAVYGKDRVAALAARLPSRQLSVSHVVSTGTLDIHANSLAGGLVGSCEGTTIKNCSIEQVDIECGYQAGGVVGYADNSSLTECMVTKRATISCDDERGQAGGLIGFSSRSYEVDCGVHNDAGNAEANVTGFANAGGLVGLEKEYPSGQCSGNVVDVAHVSSNAEFGEALCGGYAGSADRHTYRDCTVGSERYVSTVSCDYDVVGGFVGSANQCTFENDNVISCYVEGDTKIGGFAGEVSTSNITDCGVRGETSASNYAAPRVRGTESVGGLLGDASGNMKVLRSFASTRSIASGGAVGGLAGSSTSQVNYDNCYSSSDDLATFEGTESGVSGGSDAGGIVGHLNMNLNVWPEVINDCYTTCNVRGSSEVGGIVGSAAGPCKPSFGNDRFLGRLMSSGQPILGRSIGTPTPGYRNCAYITANGVNDGNYDSQEGVSASSIAELSTGTLTAADSHAYRSELSGKAFPYAQTSCGHHYGDWLYVEGS